MAQNLRYGFQSKTSLPKSCEVIKQQRRKSPLIFKLLNLPYLKKKKEIQQTSLKELKLKTMNETLFDVLRRCGSEKVQRDERFRDTHLFQDQFFRNPEAFISRKKSQKIESRSKKKEKSSTIIVDKNHETKDSIAIASIDTFVPLRYQSLQSKNSIRGGSLQQHIFTQRQNFIKNRNSSSVLAQKVRNCSKEKYQPKMFKLNCDGLTRWQTLDCGIRPDTLQSYAANKVSKLRNDSKTKMNNILLH